MSSPLDREQAYYESFYEAEGPAHFAKPAVVAFREYLVRRIIAATGAGPQTRVEVLPAFGQRRARTRRGALPRLDPAAGRRLRADGRLLPGRLRHGPAPDRRDRARRAGVRLP